ncbi:MAG: glycoside hydrolase family 13 protein [Bacteroidota bacterium]
MRTVLVAVALVFAGCSASDPIPDAPEAGDLPPEWAAHAVWYQIFPERFANGDPTNDPTPESMEGSWPQVGMDSLRMAGWAPTPWTWDWFEQEPWAQEIRPDDFYFTAQLRRYGGDLAGILDRLDYIASLGINAIYLNPLNDSPSLHKYDARTWRHVDPHFGPDPEGDKAIITAEDPLDPETWQFTEADRMFLDLIREAHARDIRVVLDYSWNHTGLTFWAFQDILDRDRQSAYADWYTIDQWDDPNTPEDEFAYTGWIGVPELPEIRKTDKTGDPEEGIPYDGDMDEAASTHVFAVSRRWLDPNGDGDPSDGVDGFRLDVAEMVPLGFWRRYREVVKAVNPDAILVGEIWWQQWPEIMMPPAPYLGDVFDSVMHYRPFAPTRLLVAPSGPAITPSAYAAHLDSLYAEIPETHGAALMAMSGSHDTPRLATTLFNAEIPYKYEETPRFHRDYRIDKPDTATMRSVRLYRFLQATLPGAPHVYYGDEVGMWGADDPDDRKPMLWPEFDYATETTHPFGLEREADPVAIDDALLDDTRAALALRREHSDLFAHGTLAWSPDDDRTLLVFERRHEGQVATVAVNLGDTSQRWTPPSGTRLALSVGDVDGDRLGARSAAVWVE